MAHLERHMGLYVEATADHLELHWYCSQPVRQVIKCPLGLPEASVSRSSVVVPKGRPATALNFVVDPIR